MNVDLARSVLAVDLGLRTGLAYFAHGVLAWHRSHNVGNRERLRRAAESVLREVGPVALVVVEGDLALSKSWERPAQRAGAEFLRVQAHEWRPQILLPREQTSGVEAKRAAGDLARRVIAASGLPRPRTLKNDAAEAILIGLWAARQRDWLAPALHPFT